MIAIVLIAIAAGSASALMFASIVSGALISLLLLYFAPLPLMVAALGWGPLARAAGNARVHKRRRGRNALPSARVMHGRGRRMFRKQSHAYSQEIPRSCAGGS